MEQHKDGSGLRAARRATIKDVAAAVGVAVSTVSNAYNRPDQLSKGLRERIFVEAEKLGYGGPNPVARSLRTRTSGTVAALLGEPLSRAFTDPVGSQTLLGIAEELAGASLALSLVPASAKAVLPVADGVIVVCDDEQDPIINLVLRQGMPVVMVDHPFRDNVAGVGVDNSIAARGAVGHLVAMGHSRIGILVDRLDGSEAKGLCSPERVAAASRVNVRARLQGYRMGMEAANLPWSEVRVIEAGASTDEAGREAARELLEGNDRPTAILATSDLLAASALSVAQELHIDVPRELSIVGFDDNVATQPPLTTVRQPHKEKGCWAARLLLAQLRGESLPEVERLSPKLVVRGSSGPALQD